MDELLFDENYIVFAVAIGSKIRAGVEVIGRDMTTNHGLAGAVIAEEIKIIVRDEIRICSVECAAFGQTGV